MSFQAGVFSLQGQCRWIFDPYFLAQKAILSPMLLHVTAQTFMKKFIRENLMKILCRFFA